MGSRTVGLLSARAQIASPFTIVNQEICQADGPGLAMPQALSSPWGCFVHYIPIFMLLLLLLLLPLLLLLLALAAVACALQRSWKL
jgi:cytochrome c-type biogenesis protein CcmH/NrfF